LLNIDKETNCFCGKQNYDGIHVHQAGESLPCKGACSIEPSTDTKNEDRQSPHCRLRCEIFARSQLRSEISFGRWRLLARLPALGGNESFSAQLAAKLLIIQAHEICRPVSEAAMGACPSRRLDVVAVPAHQWGGSLDQ
jgi:hypothetical protein